jgi:hypothetical protein
MVRLLGAEKRRRVMKRGWIGAQLLVLVCTVLGGIFFGRGYPNQVSEVVCGVALWLLGASIEISSMEDLPTQWIPVLKWLRIAFGLVVGWTLVEVARTWI